MNKIGQVFYYLFSFNQYLIGVFSSAGQIIPVTRGCWEHEEGQTTLHTGQNITHLVHALAAHLHAVHLQNLVTFVQESRLVCRPSAHHTTYANIIEVSWP